MEPFWKNEVKLTFRFLLWAFLAIFVISGLAGGLFVNFVFPQLADFPIFSRFLPRFPVIVNKTEEIHIDSGVNLSRLYENLRASTVTVIRSEGSFNPFERAFRSPVVGTGVIVTSDGLILSTKKLLGSPQDRVKVALPDGRIFDATIVAFDSRSELALIKITADNLPVVQFGNSADLTVGQKLVAVGPNLNPFGNPGVEVELVKNAEAITAYPKILVADSVNNYLVAAPLLGSEFWGSAITDGDSHVVGFVVDGGVLPGEFLQSALNNYLASGKFARPSAGFQYAIITPPTSEILHLPKSYGALLLSSAGKPAVAAASAAVRAGLREGDFIYKINNKELSADYTLEKIMNEARPGEKLEVVFYRANQEISAVVHLSQLP